MVEPGRGESERISSTDGLQLLAVDPERRHEPRVVLRSEHREVLRHQRQRGVAPLGVGGKLAKLHRQAFIQPARRHTRRIEVLNLPEHGLDLFQGHLLVPRVEALPDVFEGEREIAVVVDGIDERGRDGPVGVAESEHGHLPVKTILERLRLRAVGNEIGAVELAVRRVAVERGRVVDVLPHAVDGEIGGDVDGDDLGLGAGARGVVLVQFQHEIGVERILDLGVQLDGGKLQQPDGLLEPRRHRQLLAQPELQGLFHRPGRVDRFRSLYQPARDRLPASPPSAAIPARPEIARQTDRIRRPDGRNRVEIAPWSSTSRR